MKTQPELAFRYLGIAVLALVSMLSGCGKLQTETEGSSIDTQYAELRGVADSMEEEDAASEASSGSSNNSVESSALAVVRVVHGALKRSRSQRATTCALWQYTLSVPEGNVLTLRRHRRFDSVPHLERNDGITSNELKNIITVDAMTLGGRDGFRLEAATGVAITISGTVKSITVQSPEQCTKANAEAGAVAIDISQSLTPSSEDIQRVGAMNVDKNLGLYARSRPAAESATQP